MTELILKHQEGIVKAFYETNFMLFVSMSICFSASLPLGILLFALKKEFLMKQGFAYQLLSLSLNTLRSIPFLIFIFLLIPVMRLLFGTSFGNTAAVLPLSLVGISLYTRFVEQALINVPAAVIDRGISMGATKYQIIRYFLLPSIKTDLILSFTSVSISILSYSTVMGVIGAGGLGEYAFRYGYQEYDYPLMYLVVVLFILYVYIIQNIGYYLTKIFTKKRRKT